jgi:4-amino-4-deoxy-L-arabinose transferase-like glycosyltransferase
MAVILVLIIPALLINLGMMRLISDEAIRALVALEMKLSGDYITPTLGGEFYLKKPPLYNWLLVLFFKITGDYSEWTTRLPNIIFLLIYCFTIYYSIKSKYGVRKGFLSAMLFLISGRVILYESEYGLIDITFSWLIFVNFLLIYTLYRRKRYLLLFLISYTITGVTFLLKGLPPIAFQGITLLVAAYGERNFRSLFSWKHVAGIVIFFLITGSYYYAYYIINPGEFPKLISTLVLESTEKSAIAFSFGDSIANVFQFSFEILYSFVPGTLVVLLFLKRKPFGLIKQDPFLLYLSRVFIFNIIIYLISPVTYLRYVLMLVPILFIFFVEYYEWHQLERTWQAMFLNVMFILTCILFLISMPVLASLKITGFVEHSWLKATVLMAFMLINIIFFIRKTNYHLEMLIISILLMRIGFNWFILPSRVHNHWEIKGKEQVIEISKATMDMPMFQLKMTNQEYATLTPPLLYYATATRQDIIRYAKDVDTSGYYVIYDPYNLFSDRFISTIVNRPDFTLGVVKIME